jgi:hypothetical protein
MVSVYVPLPPEPDQEDVEEDVISLDLFADISLDGVTSGADSTAWEPIRIDKEDRKEQDEDVLDIDLGSDQQPAGVTSGNDDVKSSERRSKPH